MWVLATVTYLALFVASGRASMCSDGNGMTDELRQLFLDRHNMYRSRIAKGQAVNGLGGYLPKAKRMLKMIYDCDVEANTMDYIKKCKFGHNSYKDRNWWGQSIWELPVYGYNKSAAALWAVDTWYAELKEKGVPDNLIYTTELFAKVVGHFTQVAWQTSHKLGCGVVWCSTFTYAACEYNPAGNVFGSLIYQPGEPCTTDEDCDCSGCVCSRDEALCLAPAVAPTTTTTTTTTTTVTTTPTTTTTTTTVTTTPSTTTVKTPPPVPADMYKAHCSLNNGMTDEVRQMFLDKHNGYRSLVAKGQASNGRGGFTPKAARLPKMNYDCNIETNVMNWVKQCNYASSPWSDRGNGYGENMWMSPNNKMDKTNAAVESTAAWFSALQTQGKWLQADNTLNFMAYYFGAQNYTQMVWQKSLSIGCAAVSCDTMTLVGCHYKFTNTVNGLIYEMGDPCSTNEDCKCNGCICSKEEALCLVPPQSQYSFWQ